MQAPSDRFHVAIIMDGNGRWARARGLPRIAGHRAGAQAVRRAVEASPSLGITTLTLYAFSSDNWYRPAAEVSALMSLLEEYLEREVAECAEKGVRLNVIGRRDRLPRSVVEAIVRAEAATARAERLELRIAVDYSARHAILAAAQEASSQAPQSQEEFSRLIARATHSTSRAPDVDLLIRTSGERRLSDFLLWECAYAELLFTDRLWPDFSAADLRAAVADFQRRERRFGRLLEARG
jgi:undecaprenyl diphosphate synthase